MKIEILDIATGDLRDGQRFYERQQEGLGAYFLDSLFSDIDALLLYAGIHQQFSGYHRAFQNASLTQSTTGCAAKPSRYGACWIAGKGLRA